MPRVNAAAALLTQHICVYLYHKEEKLQKSLGIWARGHASTVLSAMPDERSSSQGQRYALPLGA